MQFAHGRKTFNFLRKLNVMVLIIIYYIKPFLTVRMDFEPDHFLEEYWKNFKSFIMKLLQEFKPVSKYIDLNVMVSHLNKLKSDGKYIEIETCIEKYILMVGWIMIKYYDSYYFHIFMSRLKEWKKVPAMRPDMNKDKKNKSKYLKFIDDESFDVYIGVINNLADQPPYLEHPIYKKILNNVYIPDYDNKESVMDCYKINIKRIKTIIPILVENNKAGSLTILSAHLNLSDIIMELYDVKIMPGTSGKKIIDKIMEQNTLNNE